MSWTRLIRFIAREDGQIHLGQVESYDVGLAAADGNTITANVITGSVFGGQVTGRKLTVDKVRISLKRLFFLTRLTPIASLSARHG